MRVCEHSFAAGAVALVIVMSVQAAGTAQAATCKDELDRFEARLHSSSIAATEPERFAELVRLAEGAAELRDEQRCLQRVAELNQELPEGSGVQPVSRSSSDTLDSTRNNTKDDRSRPSAPVLLVSDSDDNEADATADDASATEDDDGEKLDNNLE